MTLYPSYTIVLLLEGAPLHKLHLWIIPFDEFGQLPYSIQQLPFSDSECGEGLKLLLTYANPPSGSGPRRLSLWEILLDFPEVQWTLQTCLARGPWGGMVGKIFWCFTSRKTKSYEQLPLGPLGGAVVLDLMDPIGGPAFSSQTLIGGLWRRTTV